MPDPQQQSSISELDAIETGLKPAVKAGVRAPKPQSSLDELDNIEYSGRLQRVNQKFAQQFGRPIEVSGLDTPMHRKGHRENFTSDIRSRDLTPEQRRALQSIGNEEGVKFDDYTDTWKQRGFTGPHLHGQMAEKYQAPQASTSSVPQRIDTPRISLGVGAEQVATPAEPEAKRFSEKGYATPVAKATPLTVPDLGAMTAKRRQIARLTPEQYIKQEMTPPLMTRQPERAKVPLLNLPQAERVLAPPPLDVIEQSALREAGKTERVAIPNTVQPGSPTPFKVIPQIVGAAAEGLGRFGQGIRATRPAAANENEDRFGGGRFAEALEGWGKSIKPKDIDPDSVLENLPSEVGGFVPLIAASVANPALGVAYFGFDSAHSFYEDVKAHGGSEQQARNAARIGLGIGVLMGTVLPGTGKAAMEKLTGRALEHGVQQSTIEALVKRATGGASAFGGQTLAQEATTQAIAPQKRTGRETVHDVVKSAATGAVVGPLLHGVMEAAGQTGKMVEEEQPGVLRSFVDSRIDAHQQLRELRRQEAAGYGRMPVEGIGNENNNRPIETAGNLPVETGQARTGAERVSQVLDTAAVSEKGGGLRQADDLLRSEAGQIRPVESPVLMPPIVRRGGEINGQQRNIPADTGAASIENRDVSAKPSADRTIEAQGQYRSQLRPEARSGDILDTKWQSVAPIQPPEGAMGESAATVPPPRVPPQADALKSPNTTRFYRADRQEAQSAEGKHWVQGDPEYVSQKYGKGEQGSESLWYIDVPNDVLVNEYGDPQAVSITDTPTLERLGVKVEPQLYRRTTPQAVADAVKTGDDYASRLDRYHVAAQKPLGDLSKEELAGFVRGDYYGDALDNRTPRPTPDDVVQKIKVIEAAQDRMRDELIQRFGTEKQKREGIWSDQWKRLDTDAYHDQMTAMVEHHSASQPRTDEGQFNGAPSAYTPKSERAERSLPKTLEGQSLPKGSNLLYDRVTHDSTITTAKANLESKGVDGAAEYVRNAEPSAEATATGYAVIDEYTKQAASETDPIKRDALFAKANSIAEDMSVKMTSFGQAIEAAKTVSEFGVASAVKVGQKTAEGNGKRLTTRDTADITRDASAMKAAQAEIARLQERVNEYEAKEKKKTETRKARITKEFDAAEVAARERLARLNIMPSPIPVNPSERGAVSLRNAAPQDVINDLASVMAAKVSRGEKALADYRTEMATEFGEHFVDNRQRVEQAANRALKEANSRESTPKVTARGELAKEIQKAEATERQSVAELERAERQAKKDADAASRKAEQEDAMWARQDRAAQRQIDLSRKRASESVERGGEAEYYRNLKLDAQAKAAQQRREDIAQKRQAAKEAQEVKRKESEAKVEEKKRLADEARAQSKAARTRLADERKAAEKVERANLAWDAGIKADARANASDPVAVGAEKLSSGKDESAWRREMKAQFPDVKLDDVFRSSYEKVKAARTAHQEAQEIRRARLAGASSPEGIEQVRKQLKEQQKAHRDAQLALARTYDRLSGGRAFRLLSAYRKGMGLLSSPKTHARNILGNFAYQAFDEVARVPGAIMDFALSGATKQRGLTGPSPTGMLDSTLAALKIGGKEAIDIIRTGQTAEEAAKLQIPQEVNSGSKIIDTALNATYRLLAAEDRIFYNGALRRNLYDRARSQALTEVRTGELKRGDVGKRTQELIKYPHEQLMTDAQHDALVATFNNDNRLSDSIKRARSSLTPGQNFAIDLIMPYDRTPTNIVARMIEASPVGYLKNGKQLAQAVMRKAFTPEEQRQFSQTFGRATVGTAMLALGYRLAAAGLMTGLYDDDERKRTENREKKEAGQQAGAIKIGGQWHQISGLAPLGNLMTAGATLYEKGIGGAPSIGIDALFEQPLMRASKEIVKASGSDSSLGNFAGSAVGGFIPAIGADIATMTDDKARKTFGFEGQIKRRIPGLRNTLPEDEGVEHRKSWAVDPFHTTTDKGQTPTQIKNDIVETGKREGLDEAGKKFDAAVDRGDIAASAERGLKERIELSDMERKITHASVLEAIKMFNALAPEKQTDAMKLAIADKVDRADKDKVKGKDWPKVESAGMEFYKQHLKRVQELEAQR